MLVWFITAADVHRLELILQTSGFILFWLMVWRIFSVLPDGFTLLCWSHFFKAISAFAPWQAGCYTLRRIGAKCCRGFSGSEVMSFLTQDKSGNKTAINYKVSLRGNSNKCICVWRAGWLIACPGQMALRVRDLRDMAQVLEIQKWSLTLEQFGILKVLSCRFFQWFLCVGNVTFADGSVIGTAKTQIEALARIEPRDRFMQRRFG